MVENDIILGELKSNNTEGVINAEKQNEAVVTEEKVETEKEPEPKNEKTEVVTTETPKGEDEQEFEVNLGEEITPEKKEEKQEPQVITDWKEAIKGKTQEEIFEAIGYKPDELDEFEKGLIAHRKNGGKTEDYLYHKSKDWDKEDDISLIEMKFKRENPTLNEEQITKLIVDKYKLERDENGEFVYSEKEREIAEIQMKVDSKPERDYQKELQSKFQIKDKELVENSNKPQVKSQEEIVNETKQSLIAVPEIKSIVDSKKVAMSIPGIGKFNLPITNPDEFIDFMAGGETAIKHRFKDGSVNMENEIVASLILRHGAQTVLSSIVKAAKGQATKEIVDKNRNVTTEIKPKEVFTPDNKVTNFTIE